ncbi:hypothetical protein MIMGU_mgv1a017164mg [Erythranthe guttata]|uniref:Uncharacterized protein n=1 Tax=Erythranthe guttata TaxID=4155 RepID=A0A022Q326_ERYGU|nr:hypothetical protein MIMGU_mgv1a017164mg [Erythranthe guttata]
MLIGHQKLILRSRFLIVGVWTRRILTRGQIKQTPVGLIPETPSTLRDYRPFPDPISEAHAAEEFQEFLHSPPKRIATRRTLPSLPLTVLS